MTPRPFWQNFQIVGYIVGGLAAVGTVNVPEPKADPLLRAIERMKIVCLVLLLVLSGSEVSADNGGITRGRVEFRESDGSPSTFPYQVNVSNATLTDNADGTITITTVPAWNAIGDAADNGTIALAGYTTTFTSTLDGSSVINLINTDIDVAADTPLIDLGSYDIDDANGIFLRAQSDVDGTPTSVFTVSQTQVTFGVPMV